MLKKSDSYVNSENNRKNYARNSCSISIAPKEGRLKNRYLHFGIFISSINNYNGKFIFTLHLQMQIYQTKSSECIGK